MYSAARLGLHERMPSCFALSRESQYKVLLMAAGLRGYISSLSTCSRRLFLLPGSSAATRASHLQHHRQRQTQSWVARSACSTRQQSTRTNVSPVPAMLSSPPVLQQVFWVGPGVAVGVHRVADEAARVLAQRARQLRARPELLARQAGQQRSYLPLVACIP